MIPRNRIRVFDLSIISRNRVWFLRIWLRFNIWMGIQYI